MPRTITLAYYGANTAYYRVLVSCYAPRFAYLAIQPTTRLLGVSIGGGFQATSYVVPDNTWQAFAVGISGRNVYVYAGGTLRGVFSVVSDYEPYLPDRIGNLAPGVFSITAGLAPSTTLAPSTSLAPASPTFSAEAVCSGTVDEITEWEELLSTSKIYEIAQRSTLYDPLPKLPLSQGYSLNGPEGVIRSSFDAGIDAVRRKWTTVPQYLEVQYQLTWAQKQVLEDFWKRTTKQGTLRFNWPHPEYGAIEARFRSRPTYSAMDSECIASISLEVFS